MGNAYNTFEQLLGLGARLEIDGAALAVWSPCPLPDNLKVSLGEHTSRLKEALDPLPLVESWHPTHQDQFVEAVSSMLQDGLLSEPEANTLAYLLLIERQEQPPTPERMAGLSRHEAKRLLEPITAKDSINERSKPVWGLLVRDHHLGEL